MGSVAGLAVLAAGCDAFSSAFLAPALRAPSLSQAACSSPQLAGSAVRGRARGMGLRMQNGIDIPVLGATTLCNYRPCFTAESEQCLPAASVRDLA